MELSSTSAADAGAASTQTSDQISTKHDDNDASSATSSVPDASASSRGWPWWKAALLKWHLPLLIVLAVLLGATWPEPASAANDTPLGIICIVAIFFISGLKLKTDALFEALSNYKAWLYGIFSIMGLTCCTSLALIHIPLPQKEFPLGLAIFFVMPTTISSCIVLTGQAKGNVALALFLSVATNLMSIIMVPLWLTAVLASASDVTLDVVALLVRLVLTVLIPLLAGKLAQLIPGVNTAASQHKNALKVASSLFLCLIPWTKVSTAAEPLRTTPAGEILAVLAIGIGVHMVFLVVNTLAARALALKWPEQAAVVLAGSQKTLSVAVAVVDAAPAELGNSGLLLLPCLLSHFAQIVMDALLFSVLRSRMQRVAQQDLKAGERKGASCAPEGGPADEGAEGHDGLDEVHIALVPVGGGQAHSASPIPIPEEGGVQGGLEGDSGEEDTPPALDDAAVLAQASAAQSAQCRAVLQAVPQTNDSQAPSEGGVQAVPLSQQLAAAAATLGDASIGASLESDITDEGVLQEEPQPAAAPRVGEQFQVTALPEPSGAAS